MVRHFRLVSALTAMLLLSTLTGSISMVSAENLAFGAVGSAEGSFFFWAGLTLLLTAAGFLGAGIKAAFGTPQGTPVVPRRKW